MFPQATCSAQDNSLLVCTAQPGIHARQHFIYIQPNNICTSIWQSHTQPLCQNNTTALCNAHAAITPAVSSPTPLFTLVSGLQQLCTHCMQDFRHVTPHAQLCTLCLHIQTHPLQHAHPTLPKQPQSIRLQHPVRQLVCQFTRTGHSLTPTYQLYAPQHATV